MESFIMSVLEGLIAGVVIEVVKFIFKKFT